MSINRFALCVFAAAGAVITCTYFGYRTGEILTPYQSWMLYLLALGVSVLVEREVKP